MHVFMKGRWTGMMSWGLHDFHEQINFVDQISFAKIM